MNNGIIGWISHSDHNPIVFTQKGCEITGFLNESMRGKTLAPASPVVIEGADQKTQNNFKIFARLKRIETSNRFSWIEAKGIGAHEFRIPVILEPFHEITSGSNPYQGPFNNLHSLSGAHIRLPDKEEYYDVLRIPKKGVALGMLNEVGMDGGSLPYWYDEDKIFRSMFVCGHQGSGKTNFLRFLVNTYAGRNIKEKPAIIILDVEQEFSNFNSLKPNKKAKDFIRKVKLSNPNNFQTIKITTDNQDGKVLDPSLLDPEDVLLLMPELSERTAPRLKTILEKTYDELSNNDYKFGMRELVEQAIVKVDFESVANIHQAQKTAMKNALNTVEVSVFDQLGKGKVSFKDILQPGKVVVFDIHALKDSERRTVVLYLMIALAKYKMKTKKSDTDVILVIDEANEFFPAENRNVLRKEYVKRIETFIKTIPHKGRKRFYGLVLATQHPTDVAKTIIDLCNTKVIFRMMEYAQERWITAHLKRGYNERVKELGDGEAFIICRDIHTEPIRIYVPFLGDMKS